MILVLEIIVGFVIIWLLGYAPLSDGKAPLSIELAWLVGVILIATDAGVMGFLIAQRKKQIRLLSKNTDKLGRL